MAEPKRKRAASSDSTQNKAPRRVRHLKPGQVESHMQVVNTSSHIQRAFTRSVKQKDTEVARSAVLNTEELLEAVLVYLPAIDIVRSQGVASYWRDVINRSPQIKENIFIKVPDDTENWKVRNRKLAATNEMADILRDNFAYHKRSVDVALITSSINPLMHTLNHHMSEVVLRHDRSYGIFTKANIGMSDALQNGFLQLLRGQSSPLLEKMLVANLPVTDIVVSFDITANGGWLLDHGFAMRSTEPITMSALAEMAAGEEGCGGPLEMPGGRTLDLGREWDFPRVIRTMESLSGQTVKVTNMRLIIYGVHIASAEEREAVKAGKGAEGPVH